MQKKYQTLINVLDRLRFEAPREFKKYRPDVSDEEKINQARSRALIHLYMKVTFGMLHFNEREKQITDGGNDGGVDAYVIDKENKKVIFLQSKFRTTSEITRAN